MIGDFPMADPFPKEGDSFTLACEHPGCRRYLRMRMGNESMGSAYHKKLGYIDLRNQIWLCWQHRLDKR